MLRKRFAFGPFLLNPDSGTLLRDGEPVAVGHRGILLLEAFLQRPGEVLTKTDLIDAAWSGMAVEESNLSVQIALLRKALGPSPEGGDWITTIPRVGYRFVGPSPAPLPADVQPQPTKPSLAVLAFANLSNDPEQALFCRGTSGGDHHHAVETLWSARNRSQLKFRLQRHFSGRAPRREGMFAMSWREAFEEAVTVSASSLS